MNLYVSLLRTGVPAIAGALVAFALRYGLDLNASALTEVLTPLAAFLYYGAFRLAETQLSPRFGWLLGYARPPQYETAPVPLPRA